MIVNCLLAVSMYNSSRNAFPLYRQPLLRDSLARLCSFCSLCIGSWQSTLNYTYTHLILHYTTLERQLRCSVIWQLYLYSLIFFFQSFKYHSKLRFFLQSWKYHYKLCFFFQSWEQSPQLHKFIQSWETILCWSSSFNRESDILSCASSFNRRRTSSNAPLLSIMRVIPQILFFFQSWEQRPTLLSLFFFVAPALMISEINLYTPKGVL